MGSDTLGDGLHHGMGTDKLTAAFTSRRTEKHLIKPHQTIFKLQSLTRLLKTAVRAKCFFTPPSPNRCAEMQRWSVSFILPMCSKPRPVRPLPTTTPPTEAAVTSKKSNEKQGWWRRRAPNTTLPNHTIVMLHPTVPNRNTHVLPLSS